MRTRRSSLSLAETVEDVRQEFWRDPDASVADRDRDGRPLARGADRDPTFVGCELHRVREDVRDDLLQTLRITGERWQAFVDLYRHAQTLSIRGRSYCLHAAVDHVDNLDPREVEAQRSGDDPRGVEHV